MTLLDHLEVADVSTTDVHALMPNMGLACGADVLTVLRASSLRPRDARSLVTLTMRETTCPGCLAAGDLPAMCRAMNRNQGEEVAS